MKKTLFICYDRDIYSHHTMFNYRDFFIGLLTEGTAPTTGKYGITSTWEDLPENRPYGFLVYPDGSFGLVNGLFGHDKLVKGGPEGVERVIRMGGARMAPVSDRVFGADVMKSKLTTHARATVEDLAEWYDMDVLYEEGTVNGKYRYADNDEDGGYRY